MTTTILALTPARATENCPASPNGVEWEVIHEIPGRVRIRIPRLHWDAEYARRLQRSLLKTTAISESRINGPACSLIVSYAAQAVSATAIWDYLRSAIQAAGQEREPEPAEEVEAGIEGIWPTLGLPALAMGVAMAASPLELPFLVVGGVVFAASIPLWQRVSEAVIGQGQVTVDCLDALWLSAQLLQGNGVAAALALNLAAVGESLRQSRLEQLEHELYVLFEQEDDEIHWLSDRQQFAPVPETDREGWLHSVEETELLQKFKPVAQGAIAPTLLLSGTLGMLTGDLGRASAVLPLDMGVSLRGVTPLAVVSALTEAARQGVYIRNGRTLEKLAQVNALAFTPESFPIIRTGVLPKAGGREETPELVVRDSSLPSFIQNWRNQGFSLHLIVKEEGESVRVWAARLGINSEFVHFVPDVAALECLGEQLRSQGKRVAWITDSGSNIPAAGDNEVVISLAQGEFEADADVILHDHDLQPLGYTFALARHTLSTAYESLGIATLPNLLAVAVGALWGLNPVIAALINGGSAILAELNSLRPNSDANQK